MIDSHLLTGRSRHTLQRYENSLIPTNQEPKIGANRLIFGS